MTTVANPTAQPQQAARGQSQFEIAWQQFRKNQLAILGAVILFVLYIGAIVAPFISPYGLNEYSTSSPTKDHPPTRVRFVDPDTGALTWPFVYATTRKANPETFLTEFTEEKTTKYPLKFFVPRPQEPYTILGIIPGNVRLFGVDAPAHIFLLGTDDIGRDMFTRIWFGAQIAMTIGIVASALAFSLGVFFGAIAGYFGGWIDNLIMRTTEVLAAIPDLFILATLYALLPQNISPTLVFYGINFMLGIIGWGGIARIVRGQILSLREADYVQAALALGANPARVIFRHILPGTFTYLIVSASLAIPGFILTEAVLSFLGFGVREPASSWGLLLSAVTRGGFASFTDRPWVLVPGFFIVVTILSWNFLGDGLRDAFDPKKRK